MEVIIGLVTIFLGIVGLGVALVKLTGNLADSIDGVRDELRGDIKDLRLELRGDIGGVRAELGGRIDAVAAELAKTRMAVARLEGRVLGVPLPDTAVDAG
ncbi:MAG: hypothetical protein F4Z33_05165 [Gemmatimonadales bacterium]|nr:hypothetical protein [Gemmatimonadales bacterium]MYC88356.1 hypothetical protein [Candidatus Palauibacter denitrificans]